MCQGTHCYFLDALSEGWQCFKVIHNNKDSVNQYLTRLILVEICDRKITLQVSSGLIWPNCPVDLRNIRNENVKRAISLKCSLSNFSLIIHVIGSQMECGRKTDRVENFKPAQNHYQSWPKRGGSLDPLPSLIEMLNRRKYRYILCINRLF